MVMNNAILKLKVGEYKPHLTLLTGVTTQQELFEIRVQFNNEAGFYLEYYVQNKVVAMFEMKSFDPELSSYTGDYSQDLAKAYNKFIGRDAWIEKKTKRVKEIMKMYNVGLSEAVRLLEAEDTLEIIPNDDQAKK